MTILERLRANHRLRTPEEAEAFEEALREIDGSPHPAELGEYFRLLDDDADYPEVAIGLLHVIERSEVGDYARALVADLPSNWRKRPFWTKAAVARLLNTEGDATALRQAAVEGVEASQTTLLEIASKVAEADTPAGLTIAGPIAFALIALAVVLILLPYRQKAALGWYSRRWQAVFTMRWVFEATIGPIRPTARRRVARLLDELVDLRTEATAPLIDRVVRTWGLWIDGRVADDEIRLWSKQAADELGWTFEKHDGDRPT